MRTWTISQPDRITLPEPVTQVDVVLMHGKLNVVGTAGPARVEITKMGRRALTLAINDGELTLRHEKGPKRWHHMLGALADSSASRVHAKTVSGSITCDLENPQHSEMRFYTISGSITMRIREDTDVHVALTAISGKVTSAFPEISGNGAPGWRRANGVLGQATGRLYADATSGNISLLCRPAPVAFDAEDGA